MRWNSYVMIVRACLLFVLLPLLTVNSALAEPYLAIKNQVKCSACHVNPIGGGLRTKFGNIYGHSVLPESVSSFSSAEIGQISDYLNLGGNFRYNAEYSEDDASNQSATFKVDSAQIYMALSSKDGGLTFYLDQQVAPGATLNREAFVLYRFSGQHYIKAGKMYVPFGLRLEDDSAFVRQATGFNFDSSDNGVELGLEYGQSSLNFFVTNGTGATSNNDKQFLYGVKGEKLFGKYRLGGTFVYNDSDSQARTLYNLYAGLTWKDFTFLSEVDLIVDEQPPLNETTPVADKKQLAALLEVNYQLHKGLNLKFSSEYIDPNTSVGNDHETRFSFVAEYAPLSNLQVRFGLRSSDSIPQRPDRSSDKVFLQTHLYF